MDFSALERSSHAAAPAEAAPAAPEQGASLDSLEGKCHKCDGVGHRQSECTSRPDVQLAYNKCGGWGHYANKCPSKGEGKGKGKDDKGKGRGRYSNGGKLWVGKDGGK